MLAPVYVGSRLFSIDDNDNIIQQTGYSLPNLLNNVILNYKLGFHFLKARSVHALRESHERNEGRASLCCTHC